MKIKTEKLVGKPLSFALATALGCKPQVMFNDVFVPASSKGWPIDGVVPFDYEDAATCMGLIKEHRITIDQKECHPEIWAAIHFTGTYHNGQTFDDFVCCIADTLEQAIARCVIAMRIGPMANVPDELAEVTL